REHTRLGETQLARDAQHRRAVDCVDELRRRVEGGLGLDRKDDEIGVAYRLRVRCTTGADLGGRRLCAVAIARADDDVLSGFDEARREVRTEVARSAYNGDPHAGTAPSAASASRRRAAVSDMSVRATIGRTAPSPSSACASASSTTSASMRPG